MLKAIAALILAHATARLDEHCSSLDEGRDDVQSSSMLQASTRAHRKTVEDPTAETSALLEQINISEIFAEGLVDDPTNWLVHNSTDDNVAVSTGERNLCIKIYDGEYLAPEFLLIGAEKAGTSSFAIMFKHPGIVYPTNRDDNMLRAWPTPKELHIFDIGQRFNKGGGFWLHHFPRCSRSKRLVATEFTPSYILHEEAPHRIREFYKDQSSKIKFGVLLRDPLKRMHSAFYYYKDGLGRQLCPKWQINVEFKQYVRGVLEGRDPCGLLEDSNYITQLQRYFKVFSPSQFTIIFFKQIAAPVGNRAMVISELWQSLGLQGGHPPEAFHSNGNFHASLEEDLDAGTIAAIRSHIGATIGADKLAHFLTQGEQRPKLALYNGGGDAASVAQWIGETW